MTRSRRVRATCEGWGRRGQDDEQPAQHRSAHAAYDVDLADVAEGFIRKLVVHVNVARETVTAYEIDGEGQVGRTPTSTVSLVELIAAFDAANRAPDAPRE